MVLIRCVTLDGGALYSNKYVAPSGIEYEFYRGTNTEIKDRIDAEYFLNAGKGELFKKVTKAGELISDLKKALAEVANELPLKKKAKEEVEETVPAEPPKEESATVKKEIMDGAEIKALNKDEQTFLIESLGDGKKVPRLEGGRIKLLLHLQMKGKDLIGTLKKYKK